MPSKTSAGAVTNTNPGVPLADAGAVASDGTTHCLPLLSPADGWKVLCATKKQGDASLPWCTQLKTGFAQLEPALQEVW